MTDLLRVLPHFPVSKYASLIPTLEKHQVVINIHIMELPFETRG